MTGEDENRELRSYGRRRGRKASERQEHLKRALLPKLALDLTQPPGRPAEILPARVPSPFEGEVSRSDGGGARAGAAPPTGPTGHLPLKGGGEDIAPSGRLDEGESEGATKESFAPSGRLDEGEPVGAAKLLFLEIGFGGGEHLLWQAAHNPHATLIGCEPFEDGVVKVLTAIDEKKLANIRLHMGDARDVLRWLAPASVDRAFILFPDPWPKRKHRKRRLVNPSTLKLLARVMKPGAELRIGTDIGDYARTMLQAFRAQTDFVWQAQSPADWRVRPADWPETRYEQKAEREGRVRYYFRFLRV